ncbi:MAG: hypothetical protein QOE56_2432 [Solirubrobacterales bacterium]|jgi:RNA polymerase sigma factor (sigma-70 family)|nr:hypothetical protein [Solirubrobacterales bacterium]
MLFSDDRLTRRAIDGDERAFAAIFRRYQESLYRYCLAIVGNPEDAQDALQNTMVKVLRALPGEERRIELKPWLYRIAHNESIELIRRRRPSEELDPELVAGGAGLAEEAAQRQRLRGLLADLDQLPERQRGVLVMRELGGLGFEEIGAALGTSAAVARQTLYEARLGLRQLDAGRELGCDEVMRVISDADGRVLRRRDIRAHVRSCGTCQAFRDEIEGRRRDLAALSPLPAVVVAGMLQGLLGGSGAGAGGGIATALGGGAAKAVVGSAAMKGAATVAVVAVIGVAAADRGGLVHVGLPGDGGGGNTTSGTTLSSDAGASPAAQSGQPRVGLDASVESASAASGAGAGVGKADAAAKATDPGTAPAPASAEASPGQPQLPAASAHGQQTAATHKGGRAPAQPTHPAHPAKPVKEAPANHPAHPTHPVHPTHPSAPKATKQPPARSPQKGAPAEKPAVVPEVTPGTENGQASNSGK